MQEIKIGNQIWMTENLGVDYFRNGDEIPRVESIDEWVKASEAGQPAWCYYNNDSNKGKKYNKLYNWFAVNDPRGLAPEGWHIPNDLECKILTNNLGGQSFAAEKLIKLTGLSELDLFGGCRDIDKDFNEEGTLGCFWTTSEFDEKNAFTRCMFISITGHADSILIGISIKGVGHYVRCVKD